MSSQTIQNEIVNDREREDVLSDVHSYLQNDMSENYTKRYRAFYYSQSLRELRESINDDSIVKLNASRSAEENNSRIEDCPHFPIQISRRVDSRVRYNALNGDKPLDTDAIINAVEMYNLDDVCIAEIVIQFTDDVLYEESRRLLESIGGHSVNLNSYEQPFVAVLRGEVPNTKHVYQKVKNHHPDKYWSPSELNWKVRSLDIEELWTRAAYCDEDIMAGLYNGVPISLHQLERYAFNEIGSQQSRYGLTSSSFFINRIKKLFNNGTIGRKRWDWETGGDWTQNGSTL